jgi:adenosylmethionine-8-amino-7-oxononanoate aminotransferase
MLTNFKYDTADLREQDREHIIHPWIDLGTAKTREPMVIAESEGAHIYDSEGNKMLDGIGGMWCVNIGHAREEMRRRSPIRCGGCATTRPSALRRPRSSSAPAGGIRAGRSQARLLYDRRSTQSIRRCASCSSISTSSASRGSIITREYAYHGSTYLWPRCRAPGDRGHLDFVTDTVHHLPSPNPYRRPDGRSEAEFGAAKVKDLEDKILGGAGEGRLLHRRAAAARVGRVIVPPRAIRSHPRICRKYDVLYISDRL